MPATCSVPGKVIIFGDHAVVYPNHSAVIVPVSGAFCRVTTLPYESASYAAKVTDKTMDLEGLFLTEELENYLTVAEENYRRFEQTQDIGWLRPYQKEMNFAQLIIAIAADDVRQRGIPPKPIHLELQSSVPQGGMGSSAAVAASLIGAFAQYHQRELSRQEWYELTLKAERFHHGQPSGSDPATVVYNQPICLTKDRAGLNIITPLGSAVTRPEWLRHCYVVHTGRPSQTTGEVVASVRERYAQNLTAIEAIEENTQVFLSAIQNNDLTAEKFLMLINTNGRLLEDLGVVTDVGLAISRQVRASGGAAKISGAGGLGGGACGALLVCLTDQALLRQLSQHYKVYPVAIGLQTR